MTRRRRITDSEAEALLSGHTPPDRADLAATASFLRELTAQLSESEPIELAAPPRRRFRLLVGVAATVAAVVGLAGVVALRGTSNDIVRPAVGGVVSTAAEATTSSPPPATTSASEPATTVTSPPDATPSVSGPPLVAAGTGTTDTSIPDTPLARFNAARLEWDKCVAAQGQAACGAAPVPGDFGVVVSTIAPAVSSSPTIVAQPSAPGPADRAPECPSSSTVPGFPHPELTC